MALRDRFSKITSYFSSDDLEEVNGGKVQPAETVEKGFTIRAATKAPHPDLVKTGDEKGSESPLVVTTEPISVAKLEPSSVAPSNRPAAPTSRPEHPKVQVKEEKRERPAVQTSYQNRTQIPLPARPAAPTTPPTSREKVKSEEAAEITAKISLRHPLRYEDATTIADLFLDGQCVLVDFEYMQEIPARRCIDFLTGACRVVKGRFERIGSTMYILTPAGVELDIEEVRPQVEEQTTSYDFDMKRR